MDPEVRKDNLQVKTIIYFIQNCIPMINEHLTYMDEELALSLINIVDAFKNIEESDDKQNDKQILDISETAFAIDDRISFNLTGSMSAMKKKVFHR